MHVSGLRGGAGDRRPDAGLRRSSDGVMPGAVCHLPAEYVPDLPVGSLQRRTPVFVFVFLQLDLEPEGKVYIHISLTGSFIDGKAAASEAACHTPAGTRQRVSPPRVL